MMFVSNFGTLWNHNLTSTFGVILNAENLTCVLLAYRTVDVAHFRVKYSKYIASNSAVVYHRLKIFIQARDKKDNRFIRAIALQWTQELVKL